jgi:hypothetical protein
MGFDYLAFIDHIARSARTGVSHIDFGFGGSTTDEMLTTMRFPGRGFGANLTSRTFSAFIDAACASGAFGSSRDEAVRKTRRLVSGRPFGWSRN